MANQLLKGAAFPKRGKRKNLVKGKKLKISLIKCKFHPKYIFE